MKYIPNLVCKNEMLKEIGMTAEELFSDIPQNLRHGAKLPEPLSEVEIVAKMREIANKNNKLVSFLGGGVWNHYIPAHIKHLIGRSEFYTAYTPYQPEVSQGMLQALFEYQSLIAELTGLNAVNSSLYDWSAALSEAALMCRRATQKNEFLIPDILSSEKKEVLKTWAGGGGVKIQEIGHLENGQLDLEDLKAKISEKTCGVYIENPSYFGFFQEQLQEIGEIAHDKKALFVAGVDPISLGIVKTPGDYGADVCIGEAQPFGMPPNFGGPLAGIFAVRDDMDLMRKMPGRMIGLTADAEGKRGFVMTLQTREQHIRREKATSNVCTNEAICAVAAGIGIVTLGKKGIKELGELCIRNANYAIEKINELSGYAAPIFNSVHFRDFTVKCEKNPAEKLLQNGIHGGKLLDKEGYKNTFLYSVTDLHTKKDVDKLAEVLKNV